jgi:hypothetical protein
MTLTKFLPSAILSTLPYLFLIAGTCHAQTAPVPVPVPASYQSLYNSMETDMSTFTQSIPTTYNASTVYAVQLLAASSDNGMSLLGANTMAGVQMEMNQLRALGVTAFTVHIDFPYLYAPYYSDQTQYQQMLAFYMNLASEVHGMGMKLIVETQVAKANPITGASAAGTYAQQLPWAAYMAGRAQNAAIVASEVRPDYLTVISEPDTEAQMSGQTQAGTVTGSVQMLQTIITAVNAAGASGIKLGAGTGSWMTNISSYMTAYAQQPVSYLDLHVYTVNDNFLPNTITASNIAHKAGKTMGMSEAWLQKVSDSQLGESSANIGMQLNNYSFFEPLDAQFLQAMVKLANYEDFAFISPFYSNYFFAYLPYSASSSPSVAVAMQAGAAAMQQGQYSTLGPVFENMILLTPDHTAPQVPSAPIAQATKTLVALSWNPATDNVGVAGYQVFKNGALIGTTITTNFVDSNGSKGSGASYTLDAFDASGNVSPHSAATVVH